MGFEIVSRGAKQAARNPFLLSWILRHMSFALPVERLCETETLLAFHHPAPAYALHILLVPKRAIANLMELDPESDAEFLADVYTTVQELVRRFGLARGGYRLVVNGGDYQDFQYLHFHLVTDALPGK